MSKHHADSFITKAIPFHKFTFQNLDKYPQIHFCDIKSILPFSYLLKIINTEKFLYFNANFPKKVTTFVFDFKGVV